MVSAGRVLIMPKGAWNSTDTYSMLDLVSYNGSSYVAKTSVPANTLPTNTSYWQLSAYGGSASNVDGNFALTETTDYASRNYTVGDFLVTKDSVFCKVKASITTGDQLVMDTNIEATSVAALYDAALDYTDGLDEKNVKLQGQTAITTQTDLNDLTTVGNYYKSSTGVYVTNAPTGIASELTAIFRLTVENGSDTTDKVVQTLFTNDGKTYKRGYNGSTWSTWAELASAASVSTVRDAVTDVEETIAPVEASTTFAAAYSIGDQFYQGDVLYEAIAPIDIGDTLTVGTNAKVADTVTEQIATVKSDLANEVTNRAKAIEAATNHNIPRIVPKDISSYIADGTFYKRLNGTNGFTLFEDIYVGDYIKMSRAITAPNQDSQYAVTGSQYVTIIGLDTLMNNNGVSYHHAVMAPGQGFGGTQHFGRKRMYASVPFTGGYVGSEMNASTLGAVVSSGSIATGATINQQLFAEFGTHLKTVKALLSTANNSTGIGKLNGTATGCSTNWAWTDVQSVLMSEVEVYGSVVFSSSGYDTGEAKAQFPLFAFSKQAMNNGSSYYWLKDVASGSYFCRCNGDGFAHYIDATGASNYVRPRFVIAA